MNDGRLEHEYPTCWRSGHRLVWVARREYFYWIDRVKADLVEAAEKVEYYFDSPATGSSSSSSSLLRGASPGSGSGGRLSRYGSARSARRRSPPSPASSIVDQAKALPDGEGFELHRPWIDRIVLRCPKCGGDAGGSPSSSTRGTTAARPLSQPSPTRRGRRSSRWGTSPRAIDQTRGWAYTLLVLNVIYQEGGRALQGLPLPGARPRREGQEDEQEPRERRGRARDAPQRFGRPAPILHHLEELARRRRSASTQGDDRAARTRSQHALPPPRLPEAERRAGRFRPDQAHRRLGQAEEAPHSRWTAGSSASLQRRRAVEGAYVEGGTTRRARGWRARSSRS